MATAREIDRAYTAYKKRLKGTKKNPKNRQMLTKGEFMRVNYPDFGKTTRTKGLQDQAGTNLTYEEIKRFSPDSRI
jgi:hypothetical protein